MSDNAKEVEKDAEDAVEKVIAEEVKAEIVEDEKVPIADPSTQAGETPATEEKKVAEPVEEPPQIVEVPVTETVEKVVDQFENMTIFGNKSLDELQKIQSKKSHLSAGKHGIATIF